MYIEPNLKLYQNYTDFKENKGPIKYNFILDDQKQKTIELLKYNRLMILAEPGFGKSVLLKHFVSISENNGIQSISLDLKSLDLNKSLNENIEAKSKYENINKTKSFKLANDTNILVCLDAFDEVSVKNCSSIIDKITDFSLDYPNIKLFITCRSLHFQKYANQFGNINFKYLNIECFYHNDIYNYLVANHLDQMTIAIIKDIFPFEGGSNSIINTPRYLELLVRYIKEKGTSCLNTITLFDLFEYFIYFKLEKEQKVLNNISIETLKSVLEKLALVMEIYQVHELSKDELNTFFEDINSDLKNQVLSHITINDFITKSALKDNISYIEFENTEFQEYLAAKELSRFDNLNRVVYDLIVDKELREIYPSWFRVLSFLIEFKTELLKYILDFGIINNKTVTDGYFTLITKVNANVLDNQIKGDIFKQVFDYHQLNKILITYSLSENVSYYANESSIKLLKENYNSIAKNKKIDFTSIRNILYLIYNISKRRLLKEDDEIFWENVYLEFLKNTFIETSIKRHLLFLIQYIYNSNIEKALSKLPYSKDIELLRSMIHYLSSVSIDSDLMSILIIEGLRKRMGVSNRYFFQIKQLNQIKKLIKAINNDSNLINNFYSNYSYRGNQEIMAEYFENLNIITDIELLKQLKIFIINSCSRKVNYGKDSEMLYAFVNFVATKDNNFIFELIDKISVTKDFWNYELIHIFGACLFQTQIDEFIKITSEKLPEYNWLVFETLYDTQYSKREEGKLLFLKCKEYFPKEFKERIKQRKKYINDDKKSEMEEYNKFLLFLDVYSTGHKNLDIFSFYVESIEIIRKYIKESISDKFKIFVIELLSSYNPLSSGLKIAKSDGKGTSYSVNPNIHLFGSAIICADMLNLNINECRQNIINYLPFAYTNNFTSIMNLINSISQSEIASLIEMYLRKDDDLWKFMPNNFINVIKNIGIFVPESESILNGYLFNKENDRINDSDRIESLLILDSYKNNIVYLKELYRKFIKENNKYLSTKINELLIVKYNDEKAIKWRLNQIIKKVFPFTRLNGVHEVGVLEDEIRSKYFAGPLMKVNDSELLKEYLKLFNESFKIQLKGKEYWEYANYIQEIVFAYFSNLKITKDINYLNILEKYAKKHFQSRDYGYILSRISLLKKEYLDYIGKPNNIKSCIQEYNRMKNNQDIKINNSKQLFDFISEIIKIDLNNWVTGEGSKIVDEYLANKSNKETHLQKLFKMLFENILFKKYFSAKDFSIFREPQSLDDKRVDFLIGYGFITPVLIELKLSNSTDLSGRKLRLKESYRNLQRYINNHNVEFTIFLVFEVKTRKANSYLAHLRKIKKEYSKLKNVEVIGIPIQQ